MHANTFQKGPFEAHCGSLDVPNATWPVNLTITIPTVGGHPDEFTIHAKSIQDLCQLLEVVSMAIVKLIAGQPEMSMPSIVAAPVGENL
jgi:hypothetical protein